MPLELEQSCVRIVELDPDDPDEIEIMDSPSCCFDDVDSSGEKNRAVSAEQKRRNWLTLMADSGEEPVLYRSWRPRSRFYQKRDKIYK